MPYDQCCYCENDIESSARHRSPGDVYCTQGCDPIMQFPSSSHLSSLSTAHVQDASAPVLHLASLHLFSTFFHQQVTKAEMVI